MTPIAPTRAPVLGVGAAPTLSGGAIDEQASEAITQGTGMTPDEHRAIAQGELDGLFAEIATRQSAQAAAMERVAQEARGELESGLSTQIQTTFAQVFNDISAAYDGAGAAVNATAETVKSTIQSASTQAQGELATLATESVGLLNTAITTARGRIVELQSTWTTPFTDLETRRGAEFASAATTAADSLVTNKETIAATFLGSGDAIERAKGELRVKAAKAIVDTDSTRIRAQGPTRAQTEIQGLGHAAVVAGFLQPLTARVDTAATEGETAITGAHDAAVTQLTLDTESATADVTTLAAEATAQLEQDSATSVADAERSSDQCELDLGTHLADVDAQFTNTSADIAAQYAQIGEGARAAIDGGQFLDATTAQDLVAEQLAALETADAANTASLDQLRADSVSNVTSAMTTQIDALAAFGTDAATVAERLSTEKSDALIAIGDRFALGLGALAESVRASVTAYTAPLGPDLDTYVAGIEASIQTKLTESDARLGAQLAVYQGELNTEINTYASNINPGPVADGLETKLSSICSDAWSAMRGMGTDEDKLFNALRRIETPAMGEATELMWTRVHSGGSGVRATLRGFMADDLDEGELAIGNAYLAGRRAEGARLELEDNMNWYGDDEAQIEAILRSLDPAERTAMQDLPGWESTRSELESSLGGTDLNVTQALLVNNTARADAYRLRDSINNARRDGDEDALHTALAGMNPDERALIAQEFVNIQNNVQANAVNLPAVDQQAAYDALVNFSVGSRDSYQYTEGATYNAQTGMYSSSVTGANRDLASALITQGNDSLSADVARFEVERTRSGGPKEQNMETALYMSSADQQAIRDPNHPDHAAATQRQAERQAEFEAAWQAQYGGQAGGPATVSDAIGQVYQNADNSALEIEAHQEMLAAGTNNEQVVALISQLSVDGAGTDEDRMQRAWAGLTPQEADQAQQIWQDRFAEGDETLHDRLFGGTFSEYSGDEAREQEIAMLGDSQYFTGEYSDRRLQAAQIEYDYTVGEHSGMLSGLAGDESDSLRINHGRLQDLLAEVGGGNASAAFDASGRFIGTEEQYRRYTELCGIIGLNAANHRERIDSIAGAVTTGIMITGAILATVLTAGAAAPAVAMITAGVTAGSGLVAMGANQLIRGGRYGWEAAAVDLGVTAVSAATAGAGAYLNSAGQATRTAGQQITRQVMTSGGQGFVDQFSRTAMTDDTWNNGFGAGIGESLYSGFRGATTNMVSTGVSQNITQRLTLSPNGSLWLYGGRGALANGLGNMSSEAVGITEDAVLRGRTIELDQAASQIGTQGALGVVQGGLDGSLGELANRRHTAQTALDEATTQYNADEEQSSQSLQQNDEEVAADLADLNERAGGDQDNNNPTADPNAEQGANVSREQAQAEVDQAETQLLSVDQDVVDTMQPRLEDVQTHLDEVTRIDSELETATQEQGGTETTPQDQHTTPQDQHTTPQDQTPAPILDLPAPTAEELTLIQTLNDAQRERLATLIDQGEDPRVALRTVTNTSDSANTTPPPANETNGPAPMSDDALMSELIRLQRMGLSESDVDYVMDPSDALSRQQRLEERRTALLATQSGNDHYPQALVDAQASADPDHRQALIDDILGSFDQAGQGQAAAALRSLGGDVDAQLELAHHLAVYRNLAGRDPTSLSDAEIISLCHAHHAMLNEFRAGESTLRKVIPMAQVESNLAMLARDGSASNRNQTGGSVADSRNTEGGLTPQEIISILGLDYQRSPYLNPADANGIHTPTDNLLFLQAPVTQQMVESAMVPLHSDIRSRMQALAENNPVVQHVLSRSKDQNPGAWGDTLDPFTGLGMTAPGPRLAPNSPLTLNQELNVGPVNVPAGSQIFMKNANGQDVLLATLRQDHDGLRHWEVSSDCPEHLRPRFQMLAAQGQANAASVHRPN